MKKLLLGLGISNSSIKNYFDKEHIEYDIYDETNDVDLSQYDYIIKSNGYRNDYPLLEEARKKKIKIVNDLDLFLTLKKDSNMILVTGSNGKTTIVSILEKCIKNGKAIGNNGLPFFDYIDFDFNYILEVSSFMLETAGNVHLKYNIITNLFITHLEHHKTFVNYVKSKCSFLSSLTKKDYVIYNYDDVLLRRIVNTYNCQKVSFSLNNKKANLFIDDGFIYYNNCKIMNTEGIKLLGEHNLYNIMACLGLLLNYKNVKENYINIIKEFKGISHRIELIKDGNIKIYNDSKSTNFNALKASLNCFQDKKVLLIVGGKRRNDDFNKLNEYLKCISCVYAFGENKEEFNKYFKRNNIKCILFSNLEDLVNNLPKNDQNIDVILFSPASTSFDLYNDFEERGNDFIKLINKVFK